MYEKKRKIHFFPESFRTFIRARGLELLGLSLLILSSFLLLTLVTYDSTDGSLNVLSSQEYFQNSFRGTGAYIADILIQYSGWSALCFPLCIAFWGFCTLTHRPLKSPLKRLLALGSSVIFLNITLASLWLYLTNDTDIQGIIGLIIAKKILHFFHLVKISFLFPLIPLLFFTAFCSLFFYSAALTLSDWKSLIAQTGKSLKAIVKSLQWVWAKWSQFSSLNPKKALLGLKINDQSHEPHLPSSPGHKHREEEEENSFLLNEELPPETDHPEISHPNLSQDNTNEHSIQRPTKSPAATATTPKSQKSTPMALSNEGDYMLPDLSLLQSPDIKKQPPLSRSTLEKHVEALTQVLQDYGVKGKIVGAKPGPVVTLYELEPAPGIKSSRIIGLADDIARSMHAISARIAIIPGKNLIGIELPNDKRHMVYLQDILTSKDFDNPHGKLNIALGKNISGAPILTDLAGMPHMIVAGTTGSGKSVGINAMILSLLYRHSPDTCRLILIDPKMLEFSMYNDIPHLLTPVVTEPNKAVFALKWAVREMENRYRGMSHLGVRNIEGYNETIKQALSEGRDITRTVQTGFDPETGRPLFEEQPINMTPLPYIVIVVDEMADLMMVAGKDIESAVQRLAQMARAAGIHVIMATQRPSVDVITGTIKANFPTRISFQVTSKFDSRTILGEQGAEQLLGRGDMLFMEAGGRIQRIHGPFVSDQEVERIVSFLKTQGAPKYVSNVCDESSDLGMDTGSSNADEGDDLYIKALAIVKSEGKASTSFIQRRLQIGYNRAARIIEQMEAAGVVSSANHVGKRDILIKEPQ